MKNPHAVGRFGYSRALSRLSPHLQLQTRRVCGQGYAASPGPTLSMAGERRVTSMPIPSTLSQKRALHAISLTTQRKFIIKSLKIEHKAIVSSKITCSSTLSCLRRSFSTSGSLKTVWGFIGLGQMGYPMAKNLRAKIPASDGLVIYDLNTDATRRFKEEVDIVTSSTSTRNNKINIDVATSPREVAERAETVITVLPEPHHVKDVFYGILDAALPAMGSDQERLFIDCSTIDPVTSKEVAHAVQSRGQGLFVDAPMSGGVVGARAGTLTFMVGSPETLIDRVKPNLFHMGSRVLHMGDQGAGLSAKLANNYLLALSNIATAEAMNLGIRWGLDKKRLGEMINACSGRCWSSEVNNPVPGVIESAPASRDYAGGFGVNLMKKDLKLAVAAAKEAGARLELATKAQEVYEAVEKDDKYKGKDFSVVYRYLSESE